MILTIKNIKIRFKGEGLSISPLELSLMAIKMLIFVYQQASEEWQKCFLITMCSCQVCFTFFPSRNLTVPSISVFVSIGPHMTLLSLITRDLDRQQHHKHKNATDPAQLSLRPYGCDAGDVNNRRY